MRRSSAPGGWAPTALALIVLAASAGIVYVRQARIGALTGGEGIEDGLQGYLDRLIERKARPPQRLVYPYSVIPGGVASPEEVAEAMKQDEVVARHYAGFDARRGRVETLREPRLAYVSYRVKDKVYFTKKPVRLFAGEQIITDGSTTIRARCGNKVEESPQMAVSAEEPSEEILNTPKLEPEPERPALGAPALAETIPAEETPLAAVVPPPDFKPLDTPVRGPSAAWLTPAPPGVFLPPQASRPGPEGSLLPPPPVTPQPGSVQPPPASGPPPVTPPPSTPPGTTPPGTPPTVPPGPPVVPPSETPPGAPPVTPPITPPGPPPVTPPATPPATPPGTPPSAPPGTPPGTPQGPPPTTPPSTPPTTPPVSGETPPPGSLPPPLLPPPTGTQDPDVPSPPPDVPNPPDIPPPDGPEPPEIPEPSTYVLVAAGLMTLPLIRAMKRKQR